MDVFEKEMQADNEEIAQLSIEEQKHLPDQPSSLDLDNLSLTSSRQSEAANKANMANSPTVAAPIQLLQEKVLLHNPKALSKLLSLMHSLKELPDTEGGFVAWVACEQAVMGLSPTLTLPLPLPLTVTLPLTRP